MFVCCCCFVVVVVVCLFVFVFVFVWFFVFYGDFFFFLVVFFFFFFFMLLLFYLYTFSWYYLLMYYFNSHNIHTYIIFKIIIWSPTYCDTCTLKYLWKVPSEQISIHFENINWAPSSEFVSSSIPSWQILTAHVQPFRGARDLAFCLNVPLDYLLVWASSEGSGETARMRRLAWTFAARIGYKYQIRLTRSNWASSWDYGTFRPP